MCPLLEQKRQSEHELIQLHIYIKWQRKECQSSDWSRPLRLKKNIRNVTLINDTILKTTFQF